MAEITGISKTTLNDIENGKVSPRLKTLEQIAKTMDVHITDLFDSEYK
jgi:DNA-binding XRE family transcriptional regulator